ncbi:FimV/HubP family polar landmark protein [Undibacterium sp. SXout7W]|uniref:FimV/HubP family polar landmark protein n=1 Tax=Undibacterium sp. SXout7W TaxID=3413049 RepID=UPI003BF2C202
MHKQKKSSVVFLGRKVLSAAVASSFLLLSQAHATGLGRLTVLSSLGQPLRAEIELTSPSKEEIDSLVPKLASPEAFRQANIEYSSALLSLRFAVEQRGSGYVIRVSSAQAMNEPFVDMLLEMNSSNGKLLREYTFLLDPAELRNSQSPQVANPAAVASAAQSTQISSKPVTAQDNSVAVQTAKSNVANRLPPKAVVAESKPGAGTYQVRAGDTLSKVAAVYKSEGVSLDQMLVSLYRANPDAFAGKNMNRLKSGQILNLPDSDAIRGNGVASTEARSIVLAHAADFNAYRNKLADHVSQSSVDKTPVKKSGSGTITTKVKEVATASGTSPDKLEISKAAPASSSKSGNGKGSAEEDKLAKEKALAESNTRLKELEKNVGDLQKILEIKNKDLAAKQAEINAKDAAKQSDQKVTTNPVANSVAASQPAPASSVQAAPASAALPSVASSANVPASSPVAAPASSEAVAASQVKPVVRKKIVAPPPPPPPEPGFFDSLPDMLLPAGAAILALLGGYGLYTTKRKKKLQQFEDSILTGSSMKANSMFGSTGGQSVDTNNSVFNSNFAPSASQLDANEVDPVAEADVYIAYGRDSQAEEILKEALRTQPDRHAVRVKLLEIYFARKDAKLFERLASELYGMTSGEGEEWEQAASMGVVLEPGNPLYAGGKAKAEFNPASALGAGTQPLEDLDPEALLSNSLSQDMLESISIIDTASHDEHLADSDIGSAEHPLDGALDFDLDISDQDVPKIPESVPQKHVPEEIDVPQVEFGTIDFDFAKPIEATEVTSDSLPDIQTNVESASGHDEFDLGGLNFDLPPVQEPVIASSDLEHDLSESEKSNDEFDLSFEPVAAEPVLPEVELSSEPAASAFEFDLSGIDLDLDAATLGAESLHSEPVKEQESNAEMSTKLDLAIAYHEIGDKEGARELLDEVIKGGTAEQVEKAKAMLPQLA